MIIEVKIVSQQTSEMKQFEALGIDAEPDKRFISAAVDVTQFEMIYENTEEVEGREVECVSVTLKSGEAFIMKGGYSETLEVWRKAK